MCTECLACGGSYAANALYCPKCGEANPVTWHRSVPTITEQDLRDKAFTLAADYVTRRKLSGMTDVYVTHWHMHMFAYRLRRSYTKLRALRAFLEHERLERSREAMGPSLYPDDARHLVSAAVREYARVNDGPFKLCIETIELRRSTGQDEPRGQFIITINGCFRCGADPETWGTPWHESKGLDGKWYAGPHFHGEA